MAWFKISDDWIDHPKVRRAGRDARDLWVAAGNRCARYLTDGLVESELLRDYANLAEIRSGTTQAKRLVAVGLWHDHETVKGCADCRGDIADVNTERARTGEALLEVRPGDFYFHQWLRHQPPKKSKQSAAAKMAEQRNNALSKMADLCEAIQLRDKDRCRYCGVRVNWKDRRGEKGATYDHVDPDCYEPDGGNFLDGVVTACRKCNGRKRDRTPEEWGTPLLPPPGHQDAGDATSASSSGSSSGASSGPSSRAHPPGFRASSGPSAASRVVRDGPGRVVPGPELGPGRGGPGLVGPGRPGSGLGLAGLVRAGPGRGPVVPPSGTTEPNAADHSPTTDARTTP